MQDGGATALPFVEGQKKKERETPIRRVFFKVRFFVVTP